METNKVIPFSQLPLSLPCYHCEDGSKIGTIIAKGKLNELPQWSSLWLDDPLLPEDYDYVIVREETDNPIMDGTQIYNYNEDPCGVFCKEEDKTESVFIQMHKGTRTNEGSFNIALQKLFYLADHGNKRRLVKAFPEFFGNSVPEFDITE